MHLLVVGDIHAAPQKCLSDGQSASQVTRLDLPALSAAPHLKGDALHRHLFDRGGFGIAVAALREILTTFEGPTVGLGYSAGGTALWRAAAEGAPLAGIFCVSSTRLRDETALPLPTEVVFGAADKHRPPQEWRTQVPGRATLIPNAEHAFYTRSETPDFARATALLSAFLRPWK